MTAREEFVVALDTYVTEHFNYCSEDKYRPTTLEQVDARRTEILRLFDAAHPAKAEAGWADDLARVADMLDAYANLMREKVPADEIERWHYLPEVEDYAARLQAAPHASGAGEVEHKVWHDHYYQAFMRWLEDDHTHWISDKDAAWQAWMYLHDEGLTPIPDAAMSASKEASDA